MRLVTFAAAVGATVFAVSQLENVLSFLDSRREKREIQQQEALQVAQRKAELEEEQQHHAHSS